ncbi:hypothetical protein NQ315_015584 [Exocentrus adspersus]|uniref:Uncharacterized protein n=1 Tax=Exocentrus adspersus TaxID=1586481 RepID=A0AAV8V9R3_9CUCU|nr:hypothetical protein NQ315_015584 [Exocentrus adspersus]
MSFGKHSELAKRGHKITLIQPNKIIENNENISHIVLSESYKIFSEHNIFSRLGNGESIVTILLTEMEGFIEFIEYQLSHPEVQELMKGNKKVDLFFSEFLTNFGFALGSKLNASMIGIVSMDASINCHTLFGNPTHPIMYPNNDLETSSAPTFKERMITTFFWILFQFVVEFIFSPVQQ